MNNQILELVSLFKFPLHKHCETISPVSMFYILISLTLCKSSRLSFFSDFVSFPAPSVCTSSDFTIFKFLHALCSLDDLTLPKMCKYMYSTYVL